MAVGSRDPRPGTGRGRSRERRGDGVWERVTPKTDKVGPTEGGDTEVGPTMSRRGYDGDEEVGRWSSTGVKSWVDRVARSVHEGRTGRTGVDWSLGLRMVCSPARCGTRYSTSTGGQGTDSLRRAGDLGRSGCDRARSRSSGVGTGLESCRVVRSSLWDRGQGLVLGGVLTRWEVTPSFLVLRVGSVHDSVTGICAVASAATYGVFRYSSKRVRWVSAPSVPLEVFS